MPRVTPFHSRTSALCQAQNWRRWAGYLVASSYELTHEREYHAIRSGAALIDISPLFKYRLSGPDAGRLLDRVTTRDISRCETRRVMYTTWCDHRGKVLDDGTVQRLDGELFRLTAADPNLLWLQDNATGLNVEILDESDAVAALALQGPTSREILNRLTATDLSGLGYFRLTQLQLDDVAVTISRTGYTGDLGYELWVDATNAEWLWDRLMEVGRAYGMLPAGILALDQARVEAGLPLIEVDYVSARHALIPSQESSPYELSLGWTVDLAKESFVGHQALRKEKGDGTTWRFVGLQVHWRALEEIFGQVGLPPQVPGATLRSSVPVYDGKRQIGYVTSHCWSPILKKYIALAHLKAPYATPGTAVMMEITVEHRRAKAAAQVVKTPFFDPPRKRK
jgi:aminomethyltransferase